MKKKTFYYLPFLIGALAALIFLSNCTVTKNIKKTEDKKTEDIHTVETNTTITQGVIETTADTLSNFSSLDSLLHGKEIDSEDGDIKIETRYDPKSRTIKTKAIQKAKKVPVNIISVSSKTTDNHLKEKITEKTKDVKREGLNFNYLWWLLLLLLIPVWKFRKLLF